MSSTWLIVAGVVGLLACAVMRVAPHVQKVLQRKGSSGGLHSLIDAYDVLHGTLLRNGETEEADYLRTKSLPAAIKPASEA